MSPWPALLNHILRCVGFYGSFTQTGRELKWPSPLPTHIKQRLVSWEENKHLCFCSFMKICAASRQPLQSRVGGLRSCLYVGYLLHWQGLDQNIHLSPGHKSDVRTCYYRASQGMNGSHWDEQCSPQEASLWSKVGVVFISPQHSMETAPCWNMSARLSARRQTLQLLTREQRMHPVILHLCFREL